MGQFTDKHFQKSLKPQNMCQGSLEVVVVCGGVCVLIYRSQVQFADLNSELKTNLTHLWTVKSSLR